MGDEFCVILLYNVKFSFFFLVRCLCDVISCLIVIIIMFEGFKFFCNYFVEYNMILFVLNDGNSVIKM